MRVSFDFDATLDMDHVQEYAKELIERGHEVWIVTSRSHAFWHDVIDVAEKVGIPHRRIIFTNSRSKKNTLLDIKPVWHLDDEWIDLKIINETPGLIGISVFGNTDFKKECETLLQ